MCAGWVISRKVELILRFKRDKMEKEHQILAKIRQQGFIFINFTEVIDHQPYSDVIQTGIFIYKLQKYSVNRWCKRSSAFFKSKNFKSNLSSGHSEGFSEEICFLSLTRSASVISTFSHPWAICLSDDYTGA